MVSCFDSSPPSCGLLVEISELVSDFSLADCNFCSAHGGQHDDTQVAVFGKLFVCRSCHYTFLKQNET